MANPARILLRSTQPVPSAALPLHFTRPCHGKFIFHSQPSSRANFRSARSPTRISSRSGTCRSTTGASWEIPVSSPVRRYTLPDTAIPIDPYGGDVQVQSIDEMAEALWGDRGGIGIIPTREVDHRFRTLKVNGIDILRGRGAPNPLLLQMYGVPEEIAPETLLPRSQPAKTHVRRRYHLWTLRPEGTRSAQ